MIGRGADQYTVRFPAGVRPEIKARAAINRRSLNAEIIFLLECALHGVNSDGVMSLTTSNPATASNNNAALQGGASITTV